MTYGILVKNDNNIVQIDDSFGRFAVVAAGTGNITEMSYGTDPVSPITIPGGLENPIIMLRPQAGVFCFFVRTSSEFYMTSPGLTGTFQYVILDTNRDNWQYFSGNQGLIVNNSVGTKIFDSRAKMMTIDYFSSLNLVAGAAPVVIGGAAPFGSRWLLTDGEYLGVTKVTASSSLVRRVSIIRNTNDTYELFNSYHYQVTGGLAARTPSTVVSIGLGYMV